MPTYTPFDRELNSIDVSDLQVLKQASEGWYIEYKQEVPNAASIAKSISAFANTYGGWLFYGISEESKENPVAGTFPGIPREEVDRVLQRMRQAVAEQINPSTHFESRALWGPCEAIGLPVDRAIVCARVPWSPSAPHVHKRGFIFRRVADGSEPLPETDRFILDQLWHRSDNICREYKEWHDRDPEFSPSERKQPFLRLMLVADLWEERGAWLDAKDETVRTILGMTQGVVTSLPFDTVYTSTDGFDGRQISNNDPHNLGLTWRLRRNLVSEVLIPIPIYTPSSPELLQYEMQGYESIGHFVDILNRYNYKSPRVIDLNLLFSILTGIVEIQRRLAKEANWTNGFFAKAKLLNTWRTTPFVDVPIILDRFEKFGPPMCLDTTVTSPRGTHPNTFTVIEEDEGIESEDLHILAQAIQIFFPIARALGISLSIDDDLEDKATPYLVALQQAGKRSLEVQRLKTERSMMRK